jgi:ABC-type transport system involved in multi-copper enzyme maturation permease subunit
MKPWIFAARADIKTFKNNLSIKALILSIVTVSILPYGLISIFGFDNISNTISVHLFVMQLLFPYICMRLTYKSISGEVEKNHHRLLLSLPIRRKDIVIGKLLSRLSIASIAAALYAVIAQAFSWYFYMPMDIISLAWITVMTVLLALVFCLIGISVSCLTSSDSIIPDIFISIVYILLIVLWRFIPFLYRAIFRNNNSTIPKNDYGTLDYLVLRLNPVESYSSLALSQIPDSINVFIPSTLRLPDFTSGTLVKYSVSPLDVTNLPVYAQEIFTVPLSMLLPTIFFLYGYWRFNSSEFQ